MGEKLLQHVLAGNRQERPLGTVGYLAVLVWSLGLILFAPTPLAPYVLGVIALTALALYPRVFQQLLHWRWLLVLGSLVVVNTLWVGAPDARLWGVIPISTGGLALGIQMAMRALGILLAVNGFAAAVGVVELAGLLERLGLRGLGFSLGIAFNLLPSLRQSSQNAWRSLRMRGGLRRERRRGLTLFFVTVVANALRRAEEIALAAESRAFAPEKARALPLKSGRFDRPLVILALVSALGLAALRFTG